MCPNVGLCPPSFLFAPPVFDIIHLLDFPSVLPGAWTPHLESNPFANSLLLVTPDDYWRRTVVVRSSCGGKPI